MTDLHEEAERLAVSLEHEDPHEEMRKHAAHTLRALSTRLAEVEREAEAWMEQRLAKQGDMFAEREAAILERDEARALAAVVGEAASLCKVLERFPQLQAIGSTIHDDLADDICALARPEETDALDRIRAEKREQCAKIADNHHDPEETSFNEDFDAGYDAAAKAIAAAIREDKT